MPREEKDDDMSVVLVEEGNMSVSQVSFSGETFAGERNTSALEENGGGGGWNMSVED